MRKQYKKPQNNQLENRFNSYSLDHVWTLDLNSLDSSWLLTVQDQTTRQTIIHRITLGQSNVFTTNDVISTLDEAIPSRQRPLVVHSDSHGQFVNKGFNQLLQRQGIQHSHGNHNGNDKPYKMHNQVDERFQRTLKGFIRKRIQDHFSLPHNLREVKLMRKLEENEIYSIVNQAVNNFNNLRGKGRPPFGASPNIMEDGIVFWLNS